MLTHRLFHCLDLLASCAAGTALSAAAILASAQCANGQQTNASKGFEYSLETIAIGSAERSVVYRTRDHIEAPNWSRDGTYLLFNFKGCIYKLPVTGDEKTAAVPGSKPQLLDTGIARKCNNDHGISFDGTQLAVSSRADGKKSQIYVVPINGGEARLITPLSPSYWHGWSPDDKTLTYCAERNGNFDIYTIPAAGGEETRLTTAPGLDDGPEYSPDGKYIYFNSERDGTMQIWRMKPDGSEQEPVVADECRNWFAHPSPDGKWIVFISFGKDVMSDEHPANRDVLLRLMPAAGGEIRVLATFFGGQGTINVPSWSPDGKKVAFVSVEKPVPPDWALPGMTKPNFHKQVPPPADYHRPTVTMNETLGLFEGQADIGGPLLPGGASYNADTKQYRITSAGYNIWYTRDECRYAWKKVSGDASLSAAITFPNPDGYFDRKAVLMFRQDLSDDSKAVMVALHGGGLIHLAQRAEKGAKIAEACRVKAGDRPAGAPPIRLGVEKRGDTFALLVSLNGEPLHQVETTADIHLEGPFYVGIGFCSHQPVTSDTAVLSDVELKESK
jgi:Tol biopolymer transport system component